MDPVLLIDFGSTYTKVTAVDAQSAELLGIAASYTTVETDINYGLQNALQELERDTGSLSYTKRLACSSAAGGLRMIVSGLVPALTAEAARVASLGAGAKILKLYSYGLTDADIDEIAEQKPDILLLTGGTDGGNSDCIVRNAEALASCKADFPVIIAGNRAAASKCEKLLSGRETYRCENVMPKLGTLNTAPVQSRIRELFLRRIIQAKGLSKAAELVSGILMPTPAAMLAAMELLSEGTKASRGLGELLAVDLGGATTDVYSMAHGLPQNDSTVLKGLPEPFAKRTVEGDIGMRYSAQGVLEAVGSERMSKLSGLDGDKVTELTVWLAQHPDALPSTPELELIDRTLACGAVETAVSRHAGSIEQVYTPMGPAWLQTGKDLSRVDKLVITGGAVIHNPKAAEIAAHAFYNPANPESLKPKAADIFIDKKYILASMGLLGGEFPDTALAIMKKELVKWNS